MSLPQAGTLVPLSTVSKKFNYTQDHLAYLCRKGFVAAERKGRKWFAYEDAVAKYQEALELAGRPVLASEQDKILKRDLQPNLDETNAVSDFSARSITKKFNIALLEIVDNIALALERLFLRYRSVVLHHSQVRIAVPAVAYAGINIGLPPANLPIGQMHENLANKPFYRESFLTVPIGLMALFMLFNINPGLPANTVAIADSELTDISAKITASLVNISANFSSIMSSEQKKNVAAEVAGLKTSQDENIGALKFSEENVILSEIHKRYELCTIAGFQLPFGD